MGIGAVAQTSAVQYYSYGTTVMAYVLPFNPPTGAVEILDEYEGVPVTEISGFNNNANITSVKLSKNITSLPASAFSGCTMLTTINLENVTVIGNSAFQGCGKLGTSLDLSNVTSVGDYAFQGCSNLTSLTIGQATIGTSAFSGTAVETLAFADGLTEIPALASQFGGSLKNVYLPSSASVIGVSAFSGCAGLTSIDLTNIEAIGASAFSGCIGLTSIDLTNIEAIGASAFSGCIGLTSVDLSNVTSIGASAFENCGDIKSKKGLEVVIWPEGLTVFPVSVFSGCAMLHSVSNLNKATEIGNYAFLNCSLLKGNFEFTNSLQYVGEDAFMGTNFTSVVLKSNPSLNASAFPDAVALNLEIEDKMEFSDDNENTFDKITYKREFTSGKFASLILPFVPEQIDQFDVYKLRENKENSLVFQVVNEFVPGTPYMVKVKEGYEDVEELTATDATIKKSGCENRVEADGWKMIGQYERIELSADEGKVNGVKYYYYKSADNGFYYSTGTLGVSPFRTYIEAPLNSSAQVRMMVRGFGGVETDIDVVELEDVLIPTVDAYYDLNGNPVQVPVEGKVYIVNGKKMIF